MYVQEDFNISTKSALLRFMRERLALTVLMLLVSDLNAQSFSIKVCQSPPEVHASGIPAKVR